MKPRSFTKTVLVIFVAALIIPGLVFSAAEKSKVIKGATEMTVSGTLVHWKDMKKIDFTKAKAKRKMKPVMNFANPKKIAKRSKEVDPVVQTTFGDEGLTRSAATMTAGTNFAGMNFSANGAGWPPDTNGDVGPTYFIQTVNTSIGIYNKSTGALVSATTFDSFFPSAVGAPCDNDNNGDPIVLYDRYNQRWFILDFAWSGSGGGASYYSIAASNTSDPTGAWWTYCLQAHASLMNDYPKCGVWHDGIYITANMFAWSGGFQYSKIWALRTPALYSGTLTQQSVTDSGSKAFSIMPTSAKSPTGPSSSAPNYMYAMDANEFVGGVDALFVWKYNVDWTTPANTTWTGPQQMNTAAFGLTGSRVPQQGTSNTLDSLYGRLMYPANYWNYGTHESVFLCHVCEYSSRRAMRWYEVRISSGTSSIYQQGTYSPDSNHRWMGAVAGDKNGNIAMGYSVSSTSMYPAIRYCGRASTDTLGVMGQGEATMVAGGGYQSSYTRWGDYSSIFIDPSDGETFWYTQEYYTTSGTNWRTRIGSFKISSTPDTTPPVISSVTATDITSSGARITWNTDEAATSVVHYGTTTSYGSTQSVTGYTTSHSVPLTGLSSNTLYHYKVVSVDNSTNSAESGDNTFTTLDASATPEIYVSNIAMQKYVMWIFYRAEGTITIKDTNGSVVPNATVYIQWSGKASGTDSGTTNSSGQITFNSGYYWGNGTFTITVTNVTHATMTYNSSLNVETSDSI